MDTLSDIAADQFYRYAHRHGYTNHVRAANIAYNLLKQYIATKPKIGPYYSLTQSNRSNRFRSPLPSLRGSKRRRRYSSTQSITFPSISSQPPYRGSKASHYYWKPWTRKYKFYKGSPSFGKWSGEYRYRKKRQSRPIARSRKRYRYGNTNMARKTSFSKKRKPTIRDEL